MCHAKPEIPTRLYRYAVDYSPSMTGLYIYLKSYDPHPDTSQIDPKILRPLLSPLLLLKSITKIMLCFYDMEKYTICVPTLI